MTIMPFKTETRIIGIDDSPLLGREVLVIGAVMRGAGWLDGVLSTYVERDGADATMRIAAMIGESRQCDQIRAVMLNGVTFGGFNVVDIEALHTETGLPVIAVTRKLPDMENIRRALDNLPGPEARYGAMVRAGPVAEVKTRWRGGPVYFQHKGVEKEDAARIIVDTAVHSRVPEPLRVAHLIATGVVLGQSSKRA